VSALGIYRQLRFLAENGGAMVFANATAFRVQILTRPANPAIVDLSILRVLTYNSSRVRFLRVREFLMRSFSNNMQ
jgi:hypothetical protein